MSIYVIKRGRKDRNSTTNVHKRCRRTKRLSFVTMFNFIADKLNVKNLGEMLAPTYTPEQELHAAIEEGLEEKFYRLLDEMNVSPHCVNAGGNMPIHTASYYGNVRMIENLLSRGIDVNTLGPRDNTPLHFASSQQRFDAVKFLITNGANPALRNRQGKTPYDIAKGDNIRQYLLPLQFRHEDPKDAMSNLPPGITPTMDPLAPRPDIAPPPMMGMAYNSSVSAPSQDAYNPLYAAPTHSAIPRGPNARITRGDFRPIQADGFGTSVGNEQLTAKYGNTRDIKVTAPPPMMAGPSTMEAPMPITAARLDVPVAPPTVPDTANPYAARGPSPTLPTGPSFPNAAPRGPPQFKIFNPKLANNNTTTAPGPFGTPNSSPSPAPISAPASGPFGAPNSSPIPAPVGNFAPNPVPQHIPTPQQHFVAPPQHTGYQPSELDSVPLDTEEVTLSASASVLQ